MKNGGKNKSVVFIILFSILDLIKGQIKPNVFKSIAGHGNVIVHIYCTYI